ncbi:hypothetical protein [Prauserella flavalba]|uniref:hypothetical protein n=1 Tax=Prauserella flavalba TaxID=1477506 RepID=UPI0036EB1A5B
MGLLNGLDDDLAGEAIRLSNRIRGVLTGIHPALERALGPRVTRAAVLRFSSAAAPAGIRKAGLRKVTAMPERCFADVGVRAAVRSMTTTVVGGTPARQPRTGTANPTNVLHVHTKV